MKRRSFEAKILSEKIFRSKIVKPKKGKGSYSRKNRKDVND